MAKRPGAVGIPRELPVAALVAAAGLPLSRLFQPGGFTGVVLSVVVLSAVISKIARRLRVPTAVSLLMSIGGLIWFCAARFYPGTLFAGIFPSGSSMHAIADGIRAGVHQTIEEAVPVVASAPLLMFVSAGVWLTMWLADAAAVWVSNPLLSIASTVPLFATPGTLVPSQRRWLDIGLFIAMAAWVLYSDERWRARRWRSPEVERIGWRAGPAVRLGLIGVVIAVVVAPLLPGWGATPLLQKKGPGSRIAFNPFVAIAPTLRRHPTVVLFTVRTAQPTYFRLTALDHFDGKVWSQTPGQPTEDIGNNQVEPDVALPGNLITQHIQIFGLAGQWLPASYDPVAVNVPGIRLEAQTRGLLTADHGELEVGSRFAVESLIPTLTRADLDKPVNYDAVALAQYLQLPSGLPREVRSIARAVAGSQPTPFAKALALQDYLRTFTYDEDVAAGHSFKDIVEFLTTTKRGYCEQFAGSMAVLARALGIPSRVAIGFGFGSRQGDLYTETTREAHAWVEIYFPTAGWVPFEPTPRGGVAQVPNYTAPQVAPEATDSSEPSVKPSQSQAVPPVARDNPTFKRNNGQGSRTAWVVPVILIGVLVLLVLGSIGFLFGSRTLRRRRAHDASSAVVVRYVEFLSWCAGAGLGKRPGETPAEHAGRLGGFQSDAAPALNRLAELAGEALWAPPNGIDPEEAARVVAEAEAGLSKRLSRRRKVLAAAGWGRWRDDV